MKKESEIPTINKIQGLYPEIAVKNDLFKKVANFFGVAHSTVKINWFHGWGIPKDKQEAVLEIMTVMIELQKATA